MVGIHRRFQRFVDESLQGLPAIAKPKKKQPE
jgi:hypothetical protein